MSHLLMSHLVIVATVLSSFYFVEAVAVPDNNPCDTNNGGCEQICHFQLEEQECSCKDGYTKDGSKCKDVKECERANICPSFQRCVELPGSYSCECHPNHFGPDCIEAKSVLPITADLNYEWINTLRDNSSAAFKELKELFQEEMLKVLDAGSNSDYNKGNTYVEVTKFEPKSSTAPTARRKRAAGVAVVAAGKVLLRHPVTRQVLTKVVSAGVKIVGKKLLNGAINVFSNLLGAAAHVTYTATVFTFVPIGIACVMWMGRTG